jgi:cytochrome P450
MMSIRRTRGIRLHEQTGPPTPLKTALLDSIRRTRFYTNILNIWSQLNPYRWLRFRLNTQAMDAFLLPHISARINANPTTKAERNQFLQLTVQSLQEEVPGGKVDRAAFLASALGHTKFFLFAGHDTTAGAICWTIRFLSLNPDALAKLRAELDSVLGADAAATLREKPHLVNSLTYTAAALKESLRLQTNVGTMRKGGPDFSLYGPADSEFPGQPFPTNRCVLWDGNWAIHKDPDVWHRVEEFLPERWLVADEADPLYPPRNAFRAFELGPRDCIGQFLAQVEMKLVLALVTREFDFAEDWEAWDASR